MKEKNLTKNHISQNSGITLVALIITIIVLLILAVVAIRAVQQSEIITHAKNSNKKYSQAQLEEVVQLVLNEYTIAKNLPDAPELEDFLKQKLSSDYSFETTIYGTIKVRKNQYEVSVKEDGTITPIDIKDVKVVANADGTGDSIAANSIASGTTLYITFTPTIENAKITKDGKEITLPYPVTENSKHIFELTATINNKEYKEEVAIIVNQFEYGIKKLQKVSYNEMINNSTIKITIATSESGASSVQTLQTEDLDWRYMGTKEDGTILLVSKNLVASDSLTLSGKPGYTNGTILLNRICNELYGQGEYAEKARNMTAEDINSLGDFDPATADPNESESALLDEYGEMYKYRMTEDSKLIETSMSTDGGKTWSNYGTYDNTWINKLVETRRGITIDKNHLGETTYMKTAYHYKISNHLNFSSMFDGLSLSERLEITGMALKFDKASFWLASNFEYPTQGGYVSLGMRYVNNNHVTLAWMGNTNDDYVSDVFTYQYSPVIELKKDVKLVEGNNHIWEIVQM